MSGLLWGLIEASSPSTSLEEPSAPLKPRVLPLSEVSSYAHEVSDVDHPPVKDFLDSRSILALDLSVSSTGVFVNWDSKAVSFNLPPLVTKRTHVHYEALLRRELVSVLLETLHSLGAPLSYTDILVEDAFSGRSKTTARMLYALNTAIDEAILDNLIVAENFHRINNVSWKSRWTRFILQDFAHLNAKDQVVSSLSFAPYDDTQTCLEYLTALNDNPVGLQDRLDSFALGVSPFLPSEPTVKVLPWTHLKIRHNTDFDSLLRGLPPELLKEYQGHVKKTSLRKTVTADPKHIHVVTFPRPLGIVASKSDEDSYLAFWHKDLL